MKNFFPSTILGLTLGILLAGYAVFAYTPPTQAPPAGNVAAPINTGPSNQTKTGGTLNVFGLWVDQSLGVTGGASFGGDVSWSGTLTGGSVPWGRLTSVPAGLADGVDNTGNFTETWVAKTPYRGGAFTPSEYGRWFDWDISSIVPVDTKYVSVIAQNVNGDCIDMGARKDGSSLGRLIDMGNCQYANNVAKSATFTVEVGATRIIELYASSLLDPLFPPVFFLEGYGN
jgi:hypothetical protein